MYHFIPQLKAIYKALENRTEGAPLHLDLLVRYLQTYFEDTIKDLPKLLERGEITFDILWALLPPLTLIYSVDNASEEPQCTLLDSYKQRDIEGEKFWLLKVHHINHDGKSLGEVPDTLVVSEFPGVKSIQDLEAFPLKYHDDMEGVRSTLVERGRLFATLPKIHHCAYSGLAHVKQERGKILKFTVKGRLIVDPLSFREHNPNYSRPEFQKANHHAPRVMPDPRLGWPIDPMYGDGDYDHRSRTKRSLKKENLSDDDLLICNPTVLGFSLERRIWGRSSPPSAFQEIVAY